MERYVKTGIEVKVFYVSLYLLPVTAVIPSISRYKRAEHMYLPVY